MSFQELKLQSAAIVLALVVATSQQVKQASALDKPSDASGFFERPGILTKEILIARGYLAKDFQIRSKDGYWLRVTRGRNPLINNGKGGLADKAPILFTHGILESYNLFVVNSFDAQPSDFSHINLADFASADEVVAQLGDLPSAKSLPLLAMDFGHEVFIMSRRGFPGSQKLSGDLLMGQSGNTNNGNALLNRGPLSSFLGGITNYGKLVEQISFAYDAKFWKFSLDEQARYDFPAAVDLVRQKSGVDKIAVVAHSAGGAITLMALSSFPELNEKLSAVILWAQSFSLGHGDIFNLFPGILPILETYVGSVPPVFTTDQIQAVLGLVCKNKLAQVTLCEALFDLVFGFSGGQQPIRPEFVNSLLYSSSSHELAQLLQNVKLGGQMHHYVTNKLFEKPVPYDLSRITNTKMSFYTSANDFVVSPADVNATLTLLGVPYRYHLVKGLFNHNSYFYHKNTSRLAIIPTLFELQQLSEGADLQE